MIPILRDGEQAMNLDQSDAKAMRATAAREHKRALADRRDAQAAHASARDADRPAPSSTGWSTKPAPASPRARRRNQRAAAAEIATPAAKARTAWAKRHPDAARAERGFRKDRAQTLAAFAHKNQGTPETHAHTSRRKQGALARLHKSGAIDREQVEYAAEIAAVVRRITADVRLATASYETRVDDGDRSETRMIETIGQVRREVAYTRWRATVADPAFGGPIAAVLEMIVGEGCADGGGTDGGAADGATGFTVVARRYGMHNRRAKRLLIDALNLWPRILYEVRRDIDEQSLTAVQAELGTGNKIAPLSKM